MGAVNVLCTTNIEFARALRGFSTPGFSLAQAFMPGKSSAKNLVFHALQGGMASRDSGPLKRADDDT